MLRLPAAIADLATGWLWGSRLSLALCVFAMVLHNGSLVLISLMLATCMATSRWFGWDVAVPVAITCLVTSATAIGVVCWWLALPAFGTRLIAAALVGIAVIGLGVVTRRRGRTLVIPEPGIGRWVGLALLPTGFLLGIAAATGTSMHVAQRWVGAISDTSEHAWFVLQIQQIGYLDYGVSLYPRGLHALAALSYTAAGQGRDLPSQLLAAGALTWLSAAVLCLSLTTIAIRLCAKQPAGTAVASGLIVGIAFLLNDRLMIQLPLAGAHSSMLALATSLLMVQFSWAQPSQRLRLRLGFLPVVAVAQTHLWSATLAVTAVTAVTLLPALISVIRQDGWSALWRLLRLPMLLAVPGAGLIVVALVSLGGGGGVAIAANHGSPVTPTGFSWGVIALAGALVIGWPASRPAAPVLGGLALMTGILLLATGHPTDLSQWYPVKGAWFLFVVSLPVAVAGGVVAVVRSSQALGRWTARLPRYGGSVSLVARTAIVFGVVLLLGPTIWTSSATAPRVLIPLYDEVQPPAPPNTSRDRVYIPSFSTQQRSTRAVTAALDYADAAAPAIALPIEVGLSPVFDTHTSGIASRMFRLQTGQLPTNGGFQLLCEQVEAVRVDDRPVVIVTALPASAVTQRLEHQGCPGTRVVTVPLQTRADDLVLLDKDDRPPTIGPQRVP